MRKLGALLFILAAAPSFAQEGIDTFENNGVLADQGRAGAEAWPVSISSGVTITSGTFTATGSFEIINMSFAVSSGSGTAVFTTTGTLNHCGITPPSASASYDFDIVTNDADEFPVMGSNERLTGKVGLAARRFLAGSHLAKITNATPDGTYKARCVILK